MTTKKKARVGRPRILDSPEVVSINLGRRESAIVARHQRRILQERGSVRRSTGRSETIRQIIRLSDRDDFIDAVARQARHEAELAERDARIADLERRLEQRKAPTTATPQAVRVQERIDAVRRHMAAGNLGPLGQRLIDDVWRSEGCQWPKVLARFEAQLRRLGGPPPDPHP